MDAQQDRTRLALEGFARAIDRRAFLRRTLQVAFATLVASAAGSLGSVQTVLAATCTCSPPRGVYCGSMGYTCQSGGNACPSACSICTTSSGCGPCIYTSGSWYSCGCGLCGMGCRKCTDCMCPSGSGCSNTCGCAGPIQCLECCGPQDMVEELNRRQEA